MNQFVAEALRCHVDSYFKAVSSFFSYGTLHYFLLTDLSHDISTWGEVQICPAGVSLVSRECVAVGDYPVVPDC